MISIHKFNFIYRIVNEKVKSDIEIARKAKMYPINKGKKFKVPDKPFIFSPMGRHVAKINLEYLKKIKKKK